MAGAPALDRRVACQSFLRRLRGGMELVRQRGRRGQSEGATSPQVGVMTSTTRADRGDTVDHATIRGSWVRRRTV
jgi:hypothetical protein